MDKVSLESPELESPDQKLHVSSVEVVWKVYVPISIRITSVKWDPSTPLICQSLISSLIFTYLLGVKLYRTAEIGR